MDDLTYPDSQLLTDLQAGGKNQDEALKQLVQDAKFRDLITRRTAMMGGDAEDAHRLLEDAIVRLIRQIRQDRRPAAESESVRQILLNLVQQRWLYQLATQEDTRRKAMDHVSRDADLKSRIFYQLRKLSCTEDEAQDYYQQGFQVMYDKLKEGKYRGGDIKGFFSTICINERRNAIRKRQPVSLEEQPVVFDPPSWETERAIETQFERTLLEGWLAQLSDKCRKTLQMWNDGYSMKEIAAEADYQDHLQAAQGRLRCFKRLMDLVGDEI